MLFLPLWHCCISFFSSSSTYKSADLGVLYTQCFVAIKMQTGLDIHLLDMWATVSTFLQGGLFMPTAALFPASKVHTERFLFYVILESA